MKATLTFDLNDHDERMAHYRCVEALNMAIVLFEISVNLKKKCMHSAENLEDVKGIDICFEQIHELLNDYGINLDKLIE